MSSRRCAADFGDRASTTKRPAGVGIRPAGTSGTTMSVSMADHWNSWFNFYSGKHPSSTLLEANVAAQSAGTAGSMPDDGQSNDDGQSISGASRLSAASTTSHRASFADQQQQQLEQMCAPIVPLTSSNLPYMARHVLVPFLIACRSPAPTPLHPTPRTHPTIPCRCPQIFCPFARRSGA